METEVVSAAKAYSASAELVVRSIGTSYYIFYADSYIGSGTIADGAVRAGTKVGLYTTNTGNTGDNVVAFPTGTSGEYDFLNQFIGGHNPHIPKVGWADEYLWREAA